MSKPNNDVKWGFKHEDGISYYKEKTIREIDKAYNLFLINEKNCVKIISYKIKHGKYIGKIIYHFIYFDKMDVICEDNTFKLIKTLGKPLSSTFMSSTTLEKCFTSK